MLVGTQEHFCGSNCAPDRCMICPDIPLLVTRGATRTPHAGGSAYVGMRVGCKLSGMFCRSTGHRHLRQQQGLGTAGPSTARLILGCEYMPAYEWTSLPTMSNVCHICCTNVSRQPTISYLKVCHIAYLYTMTFPLQLKRTDLQSSS